MVDIWEYYGYLGKIKITAVDGEVYTGYVADVIDKNEDEEPESEDIIDLYSDKGGVVSFYESEIASIEKVNMEKSLRRR